MPSAVEEIQKRLAEVTQNCDEAKRLLYDGARYALFSGGKRMRALATLTVATSLGATTEESLDPACAVEMIHTYSLIHDDLPAMDNDDFRRGKPTLHRVIPEGFAILTGDYLLTRAFELLAASPHQAAEQKVKMISCLARESGGEGMIGGQVIDLFLEKKSPTVDQLQSMHLQKTACLISASLQLGAIVANASIEIERALWAFGKQIGLAFQIQDDILDQTHGVEKHGVEGGSDSGRGKATFVTLLGLERAEEALADALRKASELLSELPSLEEPLLNLFSPLFVTKEGRLLAPMAHRS